MPVDPEFDETVLYCWLQETENEGQPLDLALDRALRFVRVRVADENDRLAARHLTAPVGRKFAQQVSQVKPALSDWQRA
jgi:hypothetical protein